MRLGRTVKGQGAELQSWRTRFKVVTARNMLTKCLVAGAVASLAFPTAAKITALGMTCSIFSIRFL